MKKLILLIFILTPLLVWSQNTLRGKITDTSGLPIFGANIYWKNTTIGTTSNEDGSFQLSSTNTSSTLVVSFIGYKTKELEVKLNDIVIVLESDNELATVSINARKQSLNRPGYKVANEIFVNKDELLKAACCNLAESFETNPSIDVNFTDALTGTRQIKMLGLTSPYIQIIQENIPNIRGAAQNFGLTFTPGTWIESIQITKGAGSVINGYESISGQINSELVKPATDSKLFFNAYGSLNGRLEFNSHLNKKVSDKWNTGLYIHGNLRDKKIDNNNDSFLDTPLSKQLNIMNRWQFTDSEKGWISFINLRFLTDDKQTGQTTFEPKQHKKTTEVWGSEINTERFEISTKLGYVFPEIPYKSFGIQMAYSNHKQTSYFGLRDYNIKHESMYSNLLYNSIISNTQNKIITGISVTHDKVNELVETTNFSRIENSLGAFFEYNYDNLENLSLSAGIRIDHHNLLNTFVTPRIHIKYNPWETGTVRLSGGRGKRSSYIFAEHQNLFGSNRNITIVDNSGKFYGLTPEIAWNYGVSFNQKFNFLERKGDITFDFYKTDFQNQIVADWENPSEILFYNDEKGGYANSFQVEINYSPFSNFSIRTAYKYEDVYNNYISGVKQAPLLPRNRVFANLAYETAENSNGSKWKFDYTLNWQGKQRLPDTSIYTTEYQLGNYSKENTLMNAQITKVFSPTFEWYIGGENLTSERQNTPILGANNPFGENFDSTIVHSPILGAMLYTGLRLTIN